MKRIDCVVPVLKDARHALQVVNQNNSCFCVLLPIGSYVHKSHKGINKMLKHLFSVTATIMLQKGRGGGSEPLVATKLHTLDFKISNVKLFSCALTLTIRGNHNNIFDLL